MKSTPKEVKQGQKIKALKAKVQSLKSIIISLEKSVTHWCNLASDTRQR